MEKYDVIVVGGGVSGAIAAIASSRMGAKTLVAEKMGFLGGMLTAGGVGPMMTFHAGNEQVVRGIADEVVERLKLVDGTTGHIIDSTGYTYSVTPFDAELLKHVLEAMLLEAGGRPLYHSMLFAADVMDGIIRGITVVTKSGPLTFEAKVFVDATGDGDLAVLSGVGYQLGREKDGICQPVTLNIKMSGIDIDKVKECVKREPEDFGNTNVKLLDKSPRLSMGGFERLFAEGRRLGEISFSREFILLFETNNPGEVIVNTTRIQRVNPTDAWELSHAEIEGRRQALELFRFMKRRIPGFENAVLLYTGPNVGVRESRKISGVYQLTTDDLLAETIFPDEIACGGYPVDVHSPDGEGTMSKHLRWGAIYGIPFRCLVNKEVANVLNVGRSISATHEACAAIRVSPIAMAVGQAGGTAAALASRQNCAVRDVVYSQLRGELLAAGAFLR